MIKRSISALVVSSMIGLPAHAHHDCTPEEATTILELAQNHRAILVGELHGTTEMPEAFLKITDEASQHGHRIVVALEHQATRQAELDDLFASKSAQDVEAKFEAFSTHDGRSSEAMKSLMVGLWSLAQNGRTIHVAGVDYWWGDDPEDDESIPAWISKEVDAHTSLRDVRMGQNAVAACEAQECDLLLYFAGNVHTNTDISMGGMWNTETASFKRAQIAPAGHIVSHHFPTAAIRLTHRGGEFSANMGDGLQANTTQSNTAIFVAEDHVPYCSYGPSRSHQYVLSVGPITSSIDHSE